MVLRSGIIIPFQFRDTKKLLMIGVAEENRNLSIWDLKNVVRAAFGIYNFEFRNKKIGFNIPDELLLQYLAQRHDLTNFVIEIGQVYDPCKENTYSQIPNCNSCRCVTQKCLDLHVTTNITNQPSHSSANLQDVEEPPLKLRITNPQTITPSVSDVSHIQIEPKIDYNDPKITTSSSEADPDESIVEQKYYTDEERTHEREIQFVERMQQEFFLQQQQQQQHMESLLQESSAPGLRQRKERMSKKQKDVYVNFLEQNPFINEHRRNDPLLDRHWSKLADILNSVPQGAVKHVAEWKQTFDNWRYRVFLYARYNSKLTDDGSSSPKSFKPLTQTDKRAYGIWIHNPDTAPPDLEKMRNVFANLDETTQQE